MESSEFIGGEPDYEVLKRRIGDSKALIVVVDIDDDLSRAGIESPIVGYERVLEAAVEFAIARPEDSDVNTMFAGLSLYRGLRGLGLNVEIAVLAGHPTNLFLGQQRVLSQLSSILSELGGPVKAILVTDSEYDMTIAELMREYVEVIGIKRVVVEQHLGIETSYMLVARYLKKAVMDPRFAKYTVGIPGILLATAGLLSIFGLGGLVLKSVAALLGIAMIVHGFNLEPIIKREVEWLFSRPGLVLAGYLLMAIFTAASAAAAYYSISQSTSIIEGMAGFFRYSIPLFSAGAVGYIIVGRILYMIVNGDLRIHSEAAAIILFLFAAIAFYRLGVSLEAVKGPNLPAALTTALLSSDFLEISIAGASLTGLVELAGRALSRRRSEGSGESKRQSSS